ncbi:MAG TPA: prefoldin subunit alpha [Candidatus Pacearchaeota archaeon]|nr:prefoldin subunit alpha [Candidatus Pacearchaeota archaeon]
MKKEMEKKLVELSVLDSRMKELEQALTLVEKNIAELQQSKQTLEEIKKLKKGNEMLSLVGFGIFAKTGLLDNEKVLINVGSNVVCKKSIDEARKLIEKKLEQALSIYSQLFSEIERINEAIQKIESELSKAK